MEALRRWLEDRGMTQKAFGDLIGVSQATVSDYLRGEIAPTMESLREIQRVTRLSFDELIRSKPRQRRVSSTDMGAPSA